jgi:hypothetical protein
MEKGSPVTLMLVLRVAGSCVGRQVLSMKLWELARKPANKYSAQLKSYVPF